MTELAKEIGLSEGIIKRLNELSGKEKIRVKRCAAQCIGGNFSCLKKENDIIRLAVILSCAVKAKDKYDSMGISEEVYYDTMSDIKIWCENNGNKGLKNYGWLKNHVKCELFRLGRLQFQIYPCKNRTLNYKKLPFDYGENLIYVHIPQGEKLEKERCIESIRSAGEFFAKHFPDYGYRWYFTESWLLFEGNREFMAENSNILAFASLFEHCYSVKIDEQAIERIFGKRRIFKKNYPENTSLQKRAKEYIIKGNRLGAGIGVIDRNFAALKQENMLTLYC